MMNVDHAATLAAQFEQVIAEFSAVIEELSDEEWQRWCPNEQRTIGVLARHVAVGIPFEMQVFRQIAAGHQPATITRAELADMNARDAEAWVNSTKDDTLALLRSNAMVAADDVRRLTDAQLQRSGKYITELPDAWTVETWIERILIGHVTGHLQSIRDALPLESVSSS